MVEMFIRFETNTYIVQTVLLLNPSSWYRMGGLASHGMAVKEGK
jgi:hypothetical protein